jgi:hypothetical protein
MDYNINLPNEVLSMLEKLKGALLRLNLLNDVIIIGSVARCLAGLIDCGSVGDLDVLISGEALVKFWDLIRELLNSGFRPVYDLIIKPPQVETLWRPCQGQYYAHPLALTINCERHLECLRPQRDRSCKRVNLDIVVRCDEVDKIPYSESFVRLILRDKYDYAQDKQAIVRAGHEEFMKCNCVSEVAGDIKQSSELRMKYLKGEVKTKETC